jgi:hypothetical protein
MMTRAATPFMNPATTGSGTKLTIEPRRISANATCSRPERATHAEVSTNNDSTSNPAAVRSLGSAQRIATNPAKMRLVGVLTPLPGTAPVLTIALTIPPAIAATKAERIPILPASAPSPANESRPSGNRIPSPTTADEIPPRISPGRPLGGGEVVRISHRMRRRQGNEIESDCIVP